LVYLSAFCSFNVYGFEIESEQNKTFKHITEVNYFDQVYLKKKLDLLESPLEGDLAPDQVVQSMLSAMYKGNYDWWLKFWDKKTRDNFELQKQQDVNFVKNLTNQWSEELKDHYVVLSRFAEKNSFVIITYKFVSTANKKESDEKYLVFVIEDNKWRATHTLDSYSFVDGIVKNKNELQLHIR
jgi:hypothetical protein